MVGRPRLLALATGIVGVVAVVLALGFSMLPSVTAAGSCFKSGAVVAFELATDMADLEAIFDKAGGACRAPALRAMDDSNRLDVYAFIPAYTAFNLLAVLFLAGGFRRPLAAAAAAAAVGALAADYVETTRLLAITKDLEAGVSMLAVSTPAAWIKFALLALHGLLLAVICLRGPPRRPILGVALVLPVAGFAAMAADPASHNLLVYAVVVAWLALVAAAFWSAARRPATPG